MKYFDFKRYKFSAIFKKINFKRYNFSKFFKFTDFESLNFKKFYKYLVIRRVEFTKFTQLLNLKRYNIARILNTSFFKSKFWLFHLPGALVFFGFLYLFIPTFYNYDKSSIENLICKNKNIECVVRGKMTKRVWMNVGDFVLITYDKESNRDEGEIEHKYDQTEANKLTLIIYFL